MVSAHTILTTFIIGSNTWHLLLRPVLFSLITSPSSSGLDGDERKMIDTTMTKLRSLVERTGISLFLVSHLTENYIRCQP